MNFIQLYMIIITSSQSLKLLSKSPLISVVDRRNYEYKGVHQLDCLEESALSLAFKRLNISHPALRMCSF